ncbi:hypothetical protein IU429_02910 [Nocardia elegans]|uniref:Uncharacterized protein n=1 Tax=Nocardia elegans TaxID=300029 RepID=A0ABW6TN63_9NOCA|nr:hypothetical protein [Nocardia elegans]MBF6446610.1 hypothetical protein [Nocardia elegans]
MEKGGDGIVLVTQTPIGHTALVKELQLVREKGLGALRRLRLPMLYAAAQRLDLLAEDAGPQPAAIESLIRQSVEHLDGGLFQEAAEFTFGLVGGTKFAPPTERRRQAAKAMSLAPDTFRKTHEKEIVEQVAEGVLTACHEMAMRRTYLAMEQRHPADSRLAVAWVERFEAYYRIWTPIYALGADLRAALSTYHEEPADHLPWDPDSDQPYDPVAQAESYARSALYRYATVELEVRRFVARHGGLWLFSDAQLESDIRDAVYRVCWHNPINEENESWLRRALATSQLEEAEPFYAQLRATNMGEMIHGIWQKFVREGYEAELADGTDSSQVHSAIQACDDYTRLVDEDWLRIADWYAPGAKAPRGVSGEELYAKYVRDRQAES